MNKPKILILSEGKTPDKSIIEFIIKKFDIKGEVIHVKVGTIYNFYSELRKENTYYMDMRKYVLLKYSEQLKRIKFLSNEISEIYLFFDYDIHQRINDFEDDKKYSIL